MDTRKQQLVVALAAAVLTTACGGGGGGGGGPTPTPPPPAPAPNPAPPPPPAPGTFNAFQAWKNFLTTTRTWTVTGTANDGKSYTIALSTSPGTTQLFPINGTAYATARVTAEQKVGGLTIGSSEALTYYDSTYAAVGTRNVINTAPATCSVATSSELPPVATALQTNGPLQVFNDLNGCLPNSTTTGTSTTTWSVVNNENIDFFCLSTAVRNANNAVTSTELDCIEVQQDGTLGDKARISVQVTGGLTLVARNY